MLRVNKLIIYYHFFIANSLVINNTFKINTNIILKLTKLLWDA